MKQLNGTFAEESKQIDKVYKLAVGLYADEKREKEKKS
jgi:hypothetical protein